jgi:hypothetical protein
MLFLIFLKQNSMTGVVFVVVELDVFPGMTTGVQERYCGAVHIAPKRNSLVIHQQAITGRQRGRIRKAQ